MIVGRGVGEGLELGEQGAEAGDGLAIEGGEARAGREVQGGEGAALFDGAEGVGFDAGAQADAEAIVDWVGGFEGEAFAVAQDFDGQGCAAGVFHGVDDFVHGGEQRIADAGQGVADFDADLGGGGVFGDAADGGGGGEAQQGAGGEDGLGRDLDINGGGVVGGEGEGDGFPAAVLISRRSAAVCLTGAALMAVRVMPGFTPALAQRVSSQSAGAILGASVRVTPGWMPRASMPSAYSRRQG